jgi:hypothetical protein
MSSPHSRRWFRLVTGALFALWVTGIVAPVKVTAGCAHYVVSGAHAFDSSTSLDLPLFSSLIFHSSQTKVPTIPGPCPGGICSGSSRLPVAPAVPQPVQTDQSCLLNVPIEVDSTGPSSELIDEFAGTKRDRTSTIDRPPRTLSAPARPR